MTGKNSVHLPDFLLKKVPKYRNIKRLRSIINDDRICTVCESAKCPNIGECFLENTLTFMILGDRCTRNCRFCGVAKGTPLPPDPKEPERIAALAGRLGLEYVVITSVTRDDLLDGGASHFASVIKAIWNLNPSAQTEILIPDFNGDEKSLRAVLAAGPQVLNHNLETCPRLYAQVRPQADYERSLILLKKAKTLKEGVYTKSGFMVGLGETKDEVFVVLKNLAEARCDIVTIGQYLPPSKTHPEVVRYVHPDEFNEYKMFGENLGLSVFAGPFVRSSYRAKEAIKWKKRKGS